MFNISGDLLKSINSKLQFDAARAGGKANVAAADFSADQMLDNAKARLARGSREAKQYGREGKIAVSDAAAIMAGQGSVSDPVIFAKLQVRSNKNAMAALFEADTDASNLRVRAAQTRYDARVGYSNMLSAAQTNLLSSNADSFSNFMKHKHRPSGWDRSPF